jgi:AcrR family transcriptional regulator
MARPRRPAARRLGRPPASESAATRDRILHAARNAFAELGYAATTNKAVADNAGVTTGAIYHYFASKFDLYRAVNNDVQSHAYTQFEAVVDASDGFVDGLEGVLELAHRINLEDPSLAHFLGAVRVDVRRNPELRSLVKPTTIRRERFIESLVDIGIATGELDASDRERTTALIRAILVGLVDAVSDDPKAHRAAVDAVEMLLEGKLIRVRHSGAASRLVGS